AHRCLEVQEAIAFLFNEVINFIDGVTAGVQIILLSRKAKGQARSLADRIADIDTATQTVYGIAGYVVIQFVVVGRAVESVVAKADAVFGPVGVDKTEVIARLVFAAGQADADAVTGTQEVVLTDGATQEQTSILSEADAGHDRARRLPLDTVVDVDLIVSARHLWGLDVDFLEEAEAL